MILFSYKNGPPNWRYLVGQSVGLTVMAIISIFAITFFAFCGLPAPRKQSSPVLIAAFLRVFVLFSFLFFTAPNSHKGLLLRSEVLYRLQHYQSALADADNALKSRPTSYKVSMGRRVARLGSMSLIRRHSSRMEEISEFMSTIVNYGLFLSPRFSFKNGNFKISFRDSFHKSWKFCSDSSVAIRPGIIHRIVSCNPTEFRFGVCLTESFGILHTLIESRRHFSCNCKKKSPGIPMFGD